MTDKTYDAWLTEDKLFNSKAQKREQKIIDRIAIHGRAMTAGERAVVEFAIEQACAGYCQECYNAVLWNTPSKDYLDYMPPEYPKSEFGKYEQLRNWKNAWLKQLDQVTVYDHIHDGSNAYEFYFVPVIDRFDFIDRYNTNHVHILNKHCPEAVIQEVHSWLDFHFYFTRDYSHIIGVELLRYEIIAFPKR